ncbi:MAG: hypothetical protein ACRED8_13605 [Caulobacteraceae bacterium]
MRSIVRWGLRGLAGLVVLVIVALGVVYANLAIELGLKWPAPARSLPAAAGPQAIASGSRLATFLDARTATAPIFAVVCCRSLGPSGESGPPI